MHESWWVKFVSKDADFLKRYEALVASALQPQSFKLWTSDTPPSQGQFFQVVDSRDPSAQVLHSNNKQSILILQKADASSMDPRVLVELDFAEVFEDAPSIVEFSLSIRRLFQSQSNDLEKVSKRLSHTVAELERDLEWMKSIHQKKFSPSFPDVRGLKIYSRYLAGLKSGGDSFDVFYSQGEQTLSIVLLDSSSYGLSSLVQGAIVQAVHRVAQRLKPTPYDLLKVIDDEVRPFLKSNEAYSGFVGCLNLRNYELKHLLVGSIGAYCVKTKLKVGEPDRVTELAQVGLGLGQNHPVQAKWKEQAQDSSIFLSEGEQLWLLSDGVSKAAGGSVRQKFEVELNLTENSQDRAYQMMESLVFPVKAALKSENDLPKEDATILLLQMDDRLLRLT